MEYKSAFIAIVGSPNVGKSTLMNYLIGEKVTIVSSKPQTTRNRIAGILTGRDYQMIFLDTPGVHTPKNRLGEYMVKTALDSLRDVEAALFVCDAKHGFGARDGQLLDQLVKTGLPIVAAVNKTDAAGRAKSQETAEAVIEAGVDLLSVFQISAKTGEGVDQLLTMLKQYLIPGPRYYPDDTLTDQPERAVAAEMIREKALNALKEEVPHGIGVIIDKMERREDKDIVDVSATIICERESHKGIIIGKGGKMLRRIASESRGDLEMLLGMKVFLQVWVKVEKDWRSNVRVMRSLGYE